MTVTGASRKLAGLFYDKGGREFHVEHPDFGAKGDGTTDDTAPIMDAISAAESAGDGSRVVFRPGATYPFNDQIAPTKSLILEGGVAGANNAGDHQGPILKWTGGAETAILFSGTGCTNAQMRGLALDNAGTATVGIDISAGHVRLIDVGIVEPTVPFSSVAIAVGLTLGAPTIQLDNVTLRQAAPINLHVVSTDTFLRVNNSTIMDPSTGGTMSVKLGDVGKAARYVHFLACTFESLTTDLANVSVFRAEQVSFDKCYFEIQGNNGLALNIPSGIERARGITMRTCRFGAISGTPYVIKSDFSSAFFTLDDNYLEGPFAGCLNNVNLLSAYLTNNKYIGSGLAWTNNRKGVTQFNNRGTGGTPTRDDGYFVERITTNVTSTPTVDASEDDLMSYTLPAQRLYENGQTLEITAWGTTAANANNKRVKLYIGGTVVLDSGAIAANNKPWFLRATLIRSSTTAGLAISEGQFNGAAIQVTHTGVTVASTGWDATQIIKVTGTGTAAADIAQKGLLVKASN